MTIFVQQNRVWTKKNEKKWPFGFSKSVFMCIIGV